MLTIGDKFPSYALKAVSDKDTTEFPTVTSEDHKGKWRVLFSWPLDFTFVCPTEIIEFGERTGEFAKRDAVLLGFSSDSEFVHAAWRREHKGLTNLPFYWLADTKRELSTALGTLHKEAGIPLRATFIVDPTNTIRWVSVNDLPVGRNPDEVIRTLDALQSGKLTPCNWKKGEKTIN